MSNTKIEWTERTWNPVTGCSPISLGCDNCYAKTMAKRLKSMGVVKYKNEFKVTTHQNTIEEPLHWKKNSMIFVCSMSDLFHDSVDFDFIDRIMHVIQKTPQHTYQILTKRPKRMATYFKNREVLPNVWLGTTIEHYIYKNRLNLLKDIKARVRFISFEPLLSNMSELNLKEIDWIIVGGESGPKARPMKKEWVLSLKNKAKESHIAFFFKQWGTWGEDGKRRSKKKNGSELDGIEIKEFPNK